MEVSQIMVEPVTIDKDQRLSHALDLLEKKGVDRLIVTQDKELTGILTYADIADRLDVSKVVAVSISRLHVSSAMSISVITVSPEEDITEVASLMLERGMSGCPVIDEDDNIVGVITKIELSQLVQKFENVKVGQLMTGENLLVASPVDRLVKARLDMLTAGFSGLPVTDGGTVVGLLTEKLVAEAMARFTAKVPGKYRSNQVRQIRVVDAMLQQPPLVNTETSIAEGATKMLDAKLNTLPVVDENERLVGIISATDFTRFVANNFQVPEPSN